MCGKFKDEMGGVPIVEVVALRPKMYSFYTTENPDGVHRAKGITRGASKTLRHQDYVDQLEQPHEKYLPNRRIGHRLHKLYSIETNKRGLCAFDDKRFLLEDGNLLAIPSLFLLLYFTNYYMSNLNFSCRCQHSGVWTLCDHAQSQQHHSDRARW